MSQETRREMEFLNNSMTSTAIEVAKGYASQFLADIDSLRSSWLASFDDWLAQKIPSPYAPTAQLEASIYREIGDKTRSLVDRKHFYF